eukprot:TRINITY_DN5016_c0_g2_i1.p1 TRINITY_DN5016_c0_g2~~TRINITY_DN5016_c0_g2_i1.p1  ORF type:complete len:233 (-),score=33.97 TRINITY_DN5016_c0_g2_i1:199-897(-)
MVPGRKENVIPQRRRFLFFCRRVMSRYALASVLLATTLVSQLYSQTSPSSAEKVAFIGASNTGTDPSRRTILVSAGLIGLTGAWAPPPSRAQMYMRTQYPPLPRDYVVDVQNTAAVIKRGCIVAVKANRGDEAAAKEMRVRQRQVADLVRDYQRDWGESDEKLKAYKPTTQGIVREHPVFLSMKDLIGKLQAGRGDLSPGSPEDMTGFRFELSRQADALIKLAATVGVDPSP